MGPYPAGYTRPEQDLHLLSLSPDLSVYRHWLLGPSCSRRGVGLPSRSAYQTAGLDPDGVSTFRTNKMRLGWALPLPRDQWCPSPAKRSAGVTLRLPTPGPVTASCFTITQPDNHEASSGVHLRSPVQSSPCLLLLDG
jgi:hypothetical protein